MLSHYHSIYLAPHLDDVALSCGGQIFAKTTKAESVLIVTIMAGTPPPAAPMSDFARSLHERWELVTDAAAGRRSEDITACRILGADYIHWEIPDCVYRPHPSTGEPLYPEWEDVISEIHPAEFDLVEQLAERIVNLPECEQIFAPLSAGHHVDHQITRAAVERGQRKKLFYYEDYPYVTETGALAEVIPADSIEWLVNVIPLSENDLRAKIESIAAYVSQLSTFFEDRIDLERQVSDQARFVGGERVWHRQTE